MKWVKSSSVSCSTGSALNSVFSNGLQVDGSPPTMKGVKSCLSTCSSLSISKI